MQIPSREAFLSELESLGYGARAARAAALGRGGREAPALRHLMITLLSGDAYEGCLALELAHGAGEGDIVLKALTHPSGLVRGRAASFVGSLVRDDEVIERVFPGLAPFVRRRVLKCVAKSRRGALAARLLPTVLARNGAAEATLLLSALDAPAVARFLPELEHAVRSWRTLVHRHPDGVLAFIQERFLQAPERTRSLLFSHYGAALTELTHLRPDAVLRLVQEFSPPDVLPGFLPQFLPCLTRRHPSEVFALLMRPAFRARLLEQGLSKGVLRQAKLFSQEQRLALAQALAEAPLQLGRFLGAFAPSERAPLFTVAFGGTSPRVLAPALVAVLPHAARDAEAARQLGLREVQEDREQQLALQALRTIEHAREPLQKAAFASKAEDRARALVLLVSCSGLSRRGMTETLAHLSRLKNEQDPVRLAVLSELARVPVSVFTPEHIPALEALVTYAAEARDTSRGTQGALQELAFRFIRAHAVAPEGPFFRFALGTLKRLAGQSGSLVLPSLEKNLPRGAEHHLFAALLPMIRSAGQREGYALIISLTQALGRRTWGMDMLQQMLEPITEAKPDWLAQTALQLWLAPPRTRDGRIRQLLARDESTVTLPIVFEHLHRRRQEWLDPYLHGRVLKGRFTTGKTGWVPSVQRGFQRWLPRQQRAFRDVLLRIAQDTGRSTWERGSVLRVLPALHVVGVDDLKPFLHSPDVPTVEAGLGALVWLDRPEPALPLLLEALNGDQARVAMYAVPRIAKFVSPETLSAALSGLLSRERLKVTVYKEVLRLLGTFRSPQSVALLRQQWARPELHRDVRIAVGHAARLLLDEPEAWALLEEMARSADTYVPASLLDQRPEELPARLRPRYAALVLQVSRHPDLAVRRQAFAALPRWSVGVEEQVAREASGRVLDLASGAEWREATHALVEATREGLAFEQVVACASKLVSAPVSEDATPERDVPALQRLKTLCQALGALPQPVRLRLRASLEAVAQVLAQEASLWPLRASLQLACLEWHEATGPARLLLALGEEIRGEPLFAPVLATAVSEAVQNPSAEWTPEVLLDIVDRLGASLSLVSLVLISVAGQRLHWREDAALRLRALRRHPGAAVRAAAHAIVTAGE
ncbi:hypothetical protein [Stigmatella aurantiaca]|uniref:Conserved uncharacterized protein n=1 Tax=Stigmatella aurantiaca (strain DW4/3-1) TaxID=378806 RepID=Q096D7_STIAD|nr:hypothetical protein [Stigmatella aurantiaca]ADO69509.1 conserved uncharacterized protein [Stigmatella aurantiaca DW4/3-1]EAU67586.1 hypothetical protein STIAU_3784 [Stigmatella aurantiaca DW4/3-1]